MCHTKVSDEETDGMNARESVIRDKTGTYLREFGFLVTIWVQELNDPYLFFAMVQNTDSSN